MKITKRQLRRIIHEEKSMLKEGFFGGADPADALPHLKKALSILARNTGNAEAMEAVITAIEALEYPEYEEEADDVDYDDGVSDAQGGLPIRKDASPAYLEGWAEGGGEL